MMPPEIQENIPLAPKTTLGVGGNAQYFVEVCDLLLLETVINWQKKITTPSRYLAAVQTYLFQMRVYKVWLSQ